MIENPIWDCPWKPNLFVVGAPKCGTTALCRYLGDRPDVYMPPQKEPLYFCADHIHREPWRTAETRAYLALYEAGREARWRGDGSVWYLLSRTAAGRIRDRCPDARIVIMLRNPVDAAASLHAQFLFSGNETIRDFERAYDAQAARRRGRHVPLRAHVPAGLQYTAVYRYAEQIERFLDAFPPDRIKVLLFETFFADPRAGYEDVLEFLDLEQESPPAFTRENARHRVRSVGLQRLLTKVPEIWNFPQRLPAGRLRDGLGRRLDRTRSALLQLNARSTKSRTITQELRERLHADFADDIDRLEAMLGLDLSTWRRSNLVEAPRTREMRAPEVAPAAGP